jgi:predicted Rossmann-fold nucleotide-binding protein
MFPTRDGANPFVMEEVQAATLLDRLGVLFERASGVIVLPGSIGTATELLVAWNINHVVRRQGGIHIPCVAVGEAWGSVANELVESIEASGTDIHQADTGAQAVDWMLEQVGVR